MIVWSSAGRVAICLLLIGLFLQVECGRLRQGATDAKKGGLELADQMFKDQCLAGLTQHQKEFEPDSSTDSYFYSDVGKTYFSLHRQAHMTPPMTEDYEKYFELKNGTLTFKMDDRGRPYNLMRVQTEMMADVKKTLQLESWDLSGKLVAITGISSGIGFSLAVALAERGAVVHGCARTREVYSWHVEAAMLGVSVAEFQTQAHSSLKAGDSLYYLPQDHHPVFNGPFNVDPKIFESIHFAEVDVRSVADVDGWLAQLEKPPDFLVLNAQTETAFTRGRKMLLEETVEGIPGGGQAAIRAQPDRFAGDIPQSAGIHYEYQHGVKYLISKLVQMHGYDAVASATDITMVSSIAAGMPGTVIGAHFAEYSQNKVLQLMWKDNLASIDVEGAQPMKVNVAMPGLFATNINFGWVMDMTNHALGTSHPHPRKVRKTDWRTGKPTPYGKFFAPYSATELQHFYDMVMGYKGSTAPFADNGGLQIAAMMRKNSGLPTEERQDVLIDSCLLQCTGNSFAALFGLDAKQVQDNALFQDFANEDENPAYVFMKMSLYKTSTVLSRLRASRTWLFHGSGGHTVDTSSLTVPA